jgi:Rrf2 family nitric oxide-sensitive transcriptional repressor
MQLTQHTDYALRLLIYLKTHEDQTASVGQIARAYGISQHHLAKVAQQLVQHGWVLSTRGRGGGLSLAEAADRVTIGDVVRALEVNRSVVECLGEHSTCPIEPACGLKRAMRQATDAFLASLDQYVLSDVIRSPKRMRALLTVSET